MKNKNSFVLAFLISLLLPLYVLIEIVLVDFEYSSESNAQSGIKVYNKNIAGRNYIVFPEEKSYFFDKINLEINLKKNSFPRNPKIKAYQNFQVTFYPQNNRVLDEQEVKNFLFENNSTDLPIGSLFTKGDSVAILLPENSYKTIFSAELFEKMQYKWEEVAQKPVSFSGGLEEKELFSYGTPYPDGTFLKTKNKIFLVWKEELFPIKEGVDLKSITKVSPIEIKSIQPIIFGECNNQPENDKIECAFEKKQVFEKSNYVFEYEGINPEDIEKIDLEISASPSKWSFRNNFFVGIDDIKLKLIKKYRGYISFI